MLIKEHEPVLPSRPLAAGLVDVRLGWVREAAEAVGGQGAAVEDIFDKPAGSTYDLAEPDWTPGQATKVREVGLRFGYDSDQNVVSGLSDGVCVVEGGLAWEVAAKAKALENEKPRTLTFAGSPERPLGDDEYGFLNSRLDVELPPGASEYDLATLFAKSYLTRLPDRPRSLDQTYVALSRQPVTLGFGYSLVAGRPVRQSTGQLVHIGQTDHGQSIQLLQAEGESGKSPDGAELIRFMAAVLWAQGYKRQPVVLVTGNDKASASLDAELANINSGQNFGVAMCGRAAMAAVKGNLREPPLPLARLSGELRDTYAKLQVLKDKLLT